MAVRATFAKPSPSLNEAMIHQLFTKESDGSTIGDNTLEAIAGAVAMARGLMHRCHDAAERADINRFKTPLARHKEVTEIISGFHDKAMPGWRSAWTSCLLHQPISPM